jgi:hypothetical protein
LFFQIVTDSSVFLFFPGHTLTTTWAASHAGDAATLMNFSTSIDAPMVEEEFVILVFWCRPDESCWWSIS